MPNEKIVRRREVIQSLAAGLSAAVINYPVAGSERNTLTHGGNRSFTQGGDPVALHRHKRRLTGQQWSDQREHLSTGTDTQAVTLTEQWRSKIDESTVLSFSLLPDSPTSKPAYLVGTDLETVSRESTIYALNRDDGTIRWSETVSGQPVVSIGPGSSVYYATGGLLTSSRVVALNESDGSEIWRESSGIPQSAPSLLVRYVPSNSTVYAIARGVTVIAFDSETGARRWRNQLQTGVQPFGFALNQSKSTAYVTGIKVSQTTTTGHMNAINLNNGGTQNWSQQRSFPVSGIPLAVGDTIYQTFSSQQADATSSSNTELIAFNASDGNVRWKQEREDGLLYSFVSDGGSFIYVTAGLNPSDSPGSNGVLEKFEKSTGDSIWEYDAGGLVLGIQRDSDRVYIASRSGEVFGLVDDAASPAYGEQEWEQSLNAGIRDAGLAKAGNVIYTGTISEPGTVYAINATDGSIISSQQVFSGYLSPIIADDGAIWTAGSGQAANSGTIENDPSYAYKLTGQGDSNTPPTPSFTVTPKNPTIGESVTLDASGSSDSDGSIQTYEWDLNDDNIYEQAGQQISYSFSSSGNQTVRLRVVDDAGATATASQTVTVTSSGGSGGAWFDGYVNENDVVDSSGLNTAISDYLSGDLSPSRLNRIINSYLGNTPV